MSISALSAAKKTCELSGWRLSNLALQKLLYIAHMIYMGRNGGLPLVSESFRAWDYGPVLPTVYHRVKSFGSSPVKNVFHSVPDAAGEEVDFLEEAVRKLRDKKAGELVAITHWDGGAWAKNYRPGRSGILIPNDDIFAEYRARTNA